MTNAIAQRTVRPARRMLHTIPLLFVLWPAAARAQDDPFARRAWSLQLAGHGAIETWNYNTSHEELWGIVPGFTYGVRDGLVIAASWPMYYVAQRSGDTWAIAATIGVRGRVYRRGRVSVFWEGDVGVSRAEAYTPPNGTRFNYVALGGGGATVRLRPGAHLVTGLRLIHVSNSGIAGRHRNPDIEAVGPHAGVWIRF